MADVNHLPRSKRLKALTHEIHDRLDKSIMEASSFDSLEGYARFAGVQWTFHRDIEALYDDAGLTDLLPGLVERRRVALIASDLLDLGHELPPVSQPPAFVSGQAVDIPTALGWLYVAEGSNLGAALLRKEAAKLGLSDTHGAKHPF